MANSSLGRRKLNSKAKKKRPDHFNSFEELRKFLRKYFKQDHWIIRDNLPSRRIEVVFDYAKCFLDSNDQKVVFTLTAEELHILPKTLIALKTFDRIRQLSEVFRFES
jgi:hypothetical protein